MDGQMDRWMEIYMERVIMTLTVWMDVKINRWVEITLGWIAGWVIY